MPTDRLGVQVSKLGAKEGSAPPPSAAKGPADPAGSPGADDKGPSLPPITNLLQARCMCWLLPWLSKYGAQWLVLLQQVGIEIKTAFALQPHAWQFADQLQLHCLGSNSTAHAA